MPSIPIEHRAQLLGPIASVCLSCQTQRVRHYCRSCDLFFLVCACSPTDHLPPAHRVYLWKPSGIEAIPSFDDL